MVVDRAHREAELARLWTVVLYRRLAILPPTSFEREWIARTVGGVHDPAPMVGSGRTPEEAVRDALVGGVVASAVRSFEGGRRGGMSDEDAARLEEALG